jgi:hypothetical protein
MRGLLDCASRRAGRDNDPVGVPEQPSGLVLNQHPPLVAAGLSVPDFHPAAGVTVCGGGGRPPYFFPPRPNRDSKRPSLLRICWLASAAILPTVSSVLMIPSSSSVGRTGRPLATVSAASAR